MARDVSSPFMPGQPVREELFEGRQEQVDRLLRLAGEADRGSLRVAFLVGERGIGKTSLAHYVLTAAERRHDVLSAHALLGGVRTLDEMVRRVFDRTLKDSIDRPWHEKLLKLFGSRVRQVGLFGVTLEFAPTHDELAQVVNDFAPAIRQISKATGKAVCLALDDINGLSGSQEFADWLKSLIDELSIAREPVRLFLLLVGLEERRRSLLELQPSLDRVFEVVDVLPWSAVETQDFYRKAFATVGVSVNQDALEMMSYYAGGLPVLAHEIGDATFRHDQDGVVTYEDAFWGVSTAAEVVGRKHVEPKVLSAIKSERYRSILSKIATSLEFEFKAEDVRGRLSEAEKKVWHNFLIRMRELGVIRTVGRGRYQFSNQLHYLFLVMALRGEGQGRWPRRL
ncbi:MAG: ATP-binding protein [Armatimonadetes bacterium]|nr:ATP-binding protein [Armatimonadota bacterium]